MDPDLDLVMAGPDQQHWSAKLKAERRGGGRGASHPLAGHAEGRCEVGCVLSAEAFILPSHQENFGIAVAEALACGKPVLLADKVNIAEDIAEDGAGLMELDTPRGNAATVEALDRDDAAEAGR